MTYIPYAEIHLTDAYSQGFVVWSVIMNGQIILETLKELPSDHVAQRVEAFRFFKEISEINIVAAKDPVERSPRSSGIDIAEIVSLIR